MRRNFLAAFAALLTLPLAAQTINPNQIRPGTANGEVLTTVTANQPPSWQQVQSVLIQTNSTPNASQSALNLVAGTGITLTNTSGGNVQISSTGGTISGSGTLGFIPLWTPNGTTLGNSHLDDGVTTAGQLTSTETVNSVVSGANANPFLATNNGTSNAVVEASNFLCPNITTSTISGCALAVGKAYAGVDAERLAIEYRYGGSVAANRGALSMSTSGVDNQEALMWDFFGNVYLPQLPNKSSLATDSTGKIIAGSGGSLSLTTTGTSGAATYSGGTLNVPQYQGALTLTTSGSSGPASLSGNTLNIPQYSGGGSGSSSPASLQAAMFQRDSSSPVLAKGGTYDGWKADAQASVGVTYDGTRYVMVSNFWQASTSQWASGFFTSPDLKAWTYVAGSLQSPGANYIFGNGGILWFANKYWYSYSYPTASSISLENSTDLVNWTTISDPLIASGADSSLDLNPVNGRMELWYTVLSSPRSIGMYDTSDGVTWTNEGVFYTPPVYPNAGAPVGSPHVFYVNNVRYLTYDQSPSWTTGRYSQIVYSPNRDTTWYFLGTAIAPDSVNSWEAQSVFSGAVIVTDTGDGRGDIPRMLYTGGDNTQPTDATDSSIGLSYGSNFPGINGESVYPLYYSSGAGIANQDFGLCWNPTSQSLAVGSCLPEDYLSTYQSSTGGLTLHTYQSGAYPWLTLNSGGTKSFLAVNNATDGFFTGSSAGDLVLRSASGSNLWFGVQGVSGSKASIRVDSSGNVYLPTLLSKATLGTDSNGELVAGTGFSNPMTTEGDLIYGGASGTPTRLAAGTAGDCLLTQGALNPPEFGPCSSGAAFTLTTTGTSGAATYSGGVLNIPQYSGTSNSFPLTIVQQASFNSSTTATASITFTFPQATAASGDTDFLLISADGSQTVTLPAEWTVDFNEVGATYSRLILLQKASASDTSATITTSTASFATAFFFEVSGSHSLDQFTVGASANVAYLSMPSITPTAGAVVFAFCAPVITNAMPAWMPNTITPAPISPSWRPVGVWINGATGFRALTGYIGQTAATGVAVTPPIIDLSQASLFSGGGIAYATFSIN